MSFEDDGPVPGARRPGDRTRHPSGLPYAGWWQRAGAELLDGLFVTLPLGIAVSLFEVPARLGSLIVFFAVFAYNWVLDSEPNGQTWGKRIVGIRVVGHENGELITRAQGAARSGVVAALSLASNFVLGLGLLSVLNMLWPLWDPKRQTWHDKAAGSIVVRTRDAEGPPGRFDS